MKGNPIMRRLLAALGAAVLIPLAAPASADTTAPCTYRNVTPPKVELIVNGTAQLDATAAIGGCPKTAGSVSVTARVQWYNPVAHDWQTQTERTWTRAWPAAYRYARQAGGTTDLMPCLLGQWRTHAIWTDGWNPGSGNSSTVTFGPGDSGVCGSYGGGD